jgi:DNA-binding NarL/FixJ family response regulator
MRPILKGAERKRTSMNIEMTLDPPSPDSHQEIRDLLENAFREALTRMAAGQSLEHLLRQLVRETSASRPEASAPRPARRLPLSEREYQVLREVAAGRSNKEIARALSLSLHTVKRHVANILNKLGVDSRVQAASFLHAHH